jgi:hypothetical protein
MFLLPIVAVLACLGYKGFHTESVTLDCRARLVEGTHHATNSCAKPNEDGMGVVLGSTHCATHRPKTNELTTFSNERAFDLVSAPLTCSGVRVGRC